MLDNIRKSFLEYIGSWAYFIGSVMADGFHERMCEIEDAENELMDADAAGEKKVDHGSN